MAPIPSNEAERLDALYQTHILDTPPEKAFDDLTRLAAHLCGVPISAVSLIDSDRQWFKSVLGLETHETSRSAAFCAHTILQHDVFVVSDASTDERFVENPLVTGEPHIRFYAGVPLITPEGLAVGSLCVIDRVPRQLTDDQKAALQSLARQAASQIEMTRRVAQQQHLLAEYHAAQEALQQNERLLQEAQHVAKIGSWDYNVSNEQIIWSEEMFRLLGFDPALGEPDHETLIAHYHPDDIALHDALLLHALKEGQPYEYDFRILPSEGVMRWVYVMGQAARDETGRIVRLYGTMMDITERKQTEEENARLAAIIESSSDAVLGITLDGTLVSWNSSAERLYGYKEGEIIGQHVSVLVPAEPHGFFAAVIQALRRGEQRKNREMRSRRSDDTWIDTVQAFSPICNQTGEMIGVAAIGHDVSEQRRAEEAVRRSEARLAEAQRVAHIGSWELDAQTQALIFSEEMYALFEMDSTRGTVPHEELLTRYHPDDVEAHTALVIRSLADHAPFVTDMRIVRRNGENRWVHMIGEPILGENGTLLRLVGTMMDITERVLVEERFRVLFEHSPEAHFLLNAAGVIDCNQAALQMFRYTERDELATIHPVNLSPQFQPDGESSLEKGRMIYEIIAQTGAQDFEWVHQRQNGEQFPAKVIATPVTLRGEPALLSVIHDLTEQKQAEQRIHDYAVLLETQKQELEQANQELCNLATTDGLTGLKNHRAFQERLQGDCESATRHQTPLSLLLLDVDHFKQFNDTFGHPAGDAVLKQVAALLEYTIRDCDFAARYGGEEFVVILPQTDSIGALQAAERCRIAIESAEWRCRPVTASFGVATLSLTCTSSPDLIAAADQALYAAKFNGRNQVMYAPSFCLRRQDALQV
jgi:diguanylate cyclase (GGDEF)-like protein/PAS domain S-box-containing protein